MKEYAIVKSALTNIGHKATTSGIAFRVVPTNEMNEPAQSLEMRQRVCHKLVTQFKSRPSRNLPDYY